MDGTIFETPNSGMPASGNIMLLCCILEQIEDLTARLQGPQGPPGAGYPGVPGEPGPQGSTGTCSVIYCIIFLFANGLSLHANVS